MYSNVRRTQIELQVIPKALHHNIFEKIYDGTKVEKNVEMSAWLNPKHLLTMDVHAGKLLSNLIIWRSFNDYPVREYTTSDW